MKHAVALSLVILALSASDRPASAQRQGQAPPIQPSGRAATAICRTNQCRLTDTSTLAVLIEYGQPHVRGREVWTTQAPRDSVWRLGANPATHLVNKVPLTIGGTAVPPGTYTLYMIPTASAGTLVISKSTGQWGVPYPGAAQDFARIPMRSRTLAENVESLSIALVPSQADPTNGVLSIAWGKREFTVNWNAQVQAQGRGGSPQGF